MSTGTWPPTVTRAWNVSSAGRASGAMRAVSRALRPPTTNGGNATAAVEFAATETLHGALPMPVNLERDFAIGYRLRTVVRHADRRGDQHALRRRRLLEGEAHDRRVRSRRSGNRNRSERHTDGQFDLLSLVPARLLVVGNEDDFPPRRHDRLQQAGRGAQRRANPRETRARARPVDGGDQGSRAGSRVRPRGHLDVGSEQHHGTAVNRTQLPHDAPRRVLRAGPAIAVAHARRPVEQHHHVTRAARRRHGRAACREERARKRERDQREREDAQGEKRPVPDRAAADGLIGDPLQEHQRRERLRRPTLALHEVHHDRDRDREQAGKQDGCEERHQRARLRRSRADR